MGEILTADEVREALYLDFDYPDSKLIRLSQQASSYLLRTTGYDFGSDAEIEPLAVQAAELYVKQSFFGGDGYNKEHDYSLGLTSLIVQLQSIAKEKLNDTSETV